MNRRKITSLLALVLAIGMFTAASVQGSAGSTLILDKFNAKNATALIEHLPDEDALGNGWFVELGDWIAEKGKAKELSTAPWNVSSDYRALIDSGESDVSAELQLKMDMDGDQFWGVVARYSGPTDWLMAFHDGVGDLILGKKFTDEDQYGNPGATYFQELGRVSMDWKSGQKAKTHTIKIVTADTTITVFADDEPVISAVDHGDMTSGVVGIFSRGQGKNQFKQFEVKLPDSGSGYSASPTTTHEGGDGNGKDHEYDDSKHGDDEGKDGKH